MNHSKLQNIRDFLSSEDHLARIPKIKRSIMLAEKIYGRRKDLGLTQAQLAEKTYTTQRIISELEDAVYTPSSGIGDQLYDKLALGLEIDRDYIVSDKIDRKSFELFAYISKKIGGNWDIMKFMKLPYFIDYFYKKNYGFQISNFSYIRWNFGPFDSKVYSYSGLFEGKNFSVEFSYIQDYLSDIDKTLAELPIDNGRELKKLSYQTAPMLAIGATLGGSENMGVELDLTV